MKRVSKEPAKIFEIMVTAVGFLGYPVHYMPRWVAKEFFKYSLLIQLAQFSAIFLFNKRRFMPRGLDQNPRNIF